MPITFRTRAATADHLSTGHGRLRARIGAAANLVGVGGMIWGVIAFLLLLIGLGAAAMAVVLSLRLTTITRDHELSARLSGVHNQLQQLTTDLLIVVSVPGGEERLPLTRTAWRRIAGEIADVCRVVGSTAAEDRASLMPLCTRIEAAPPSLDTLLSGSHALTPAVQQAAVAQLADLIGLVRKFEDSHRQLSEEENRRLGEQKRLLTILTAAAAGGLLSGLVLAYIVTGAAASYRRRWLAAAKAERAASETRAQLIEAIEAVPVGFGLYDRDARLVMFNDRLASMNRSIYSAALIGKTHHEVVEAAAMTQSWRWATGEERQAWIERQLERFRDGQRGDLQDRGDGHWFEFFEIRTPSGLTASIRHDVTALKLQQQKLEASEQRYRDLVDSLDDVIFRTGPDGRFTYVSAASKNMMGLPPEQVVGRTVVSVVHADDTALFSALARTARAAPGHENVATFRIGATIETMRYCEVRFRSTGEQNAAGHVGFTGIAHDVHERILLERRQRDDTMKLRSIVESAGALILLVDRELKAVLANRTFLAATGDASRDISGQPLDDVIACNIDKVVVDHWLANEGPAALDPVEFDNMIPLADGARRIVRVTASPVQDDTGRVDYILFLGVDDTARRSAELQLLDAARLATVGQMATGIAHEINQPLTVIGFSAESLLDDMAENIDRDDPKAFREALAMRLKRIDEQTHRAANLVRQLRIFARKPNEMPAPFDVAEAINGAVELIGEQLRLARFDIELDIGADLPSVIGHPNRLQQVLVNLVVNARDAIEEARGRQPDMKAGRWIGLRARRALASGGLTIEVSDNGPGIPTDVLPRLFEPFFTTKPSGKGTGLGLSISSEIVREMNGTIAATNRLQGGAVFRISLPAIL